MAQVTIAETRHVLAKLLPVFEKIEWGSLPTRDSLASLQDLYHTEFIDDLAELWNDEEAYGNVFYLFAVCLNSARITHSGHLWEAFSILADASREAKWRLVFGLHRSHSTSAGWPPDPRHYLYNYSHEQWSSYESESVLQAAVRALHPRYFGNQGQAAYHALRLISNCCADNDANKRVVLECGGIELLLRCANLKLWPDVVAAALYNICADSDVQNGDETELAIEEEIRSSELRQPSEPKMSTIACIQLTLVSAGECDDSNSTNPLAALIEDGRRPANFVGELLALGEIVHDEVRKEMVAELLEKASWHISLLNNTASPMAAEYIIPSSTRMVKPNLHPKDFLVQLLMGSGRALAMSHPKCKCDIVRTIAILLSQVPVKRELIFRDLVRAFLDVPNWVTGDIEGDASADHDVASSMLTVRTFLMKTIYDVSASPEFVDRYTKVRECPRLVSECIDALCHVSNLGQTMPAVNVVPAASACIVLANLTGTVEFALFLVQHKRVHLSVGLLLHQREDSTTLFPAIALLDRLAIPPENKTAIFSAGIIYELPRFLNNFDVQPRIQCEAVSVMRKVICGHPEHVRGIGVCVHVIAEEPVQNHGCMPVDEQSGLLAALNLFRRTSDVQTKIEVGRLVVEVCRTLLHSTGGYPELAEYGIRQAFGIASDIANPIAYLACNGISQELQGEGWFGLAVLSIWEHGRPFVMDCLAEEGVQNRMDELLGQGNTAFRQNISLMLTKLRLFPYHLVLASTRDILERAASKAGLPQIWPTMGPDA